jgi:FkbM family methyltransferase
LKQWIKTAIRKGSRAMGWEAFKGPNLITFLESRNVDLVFDVGANRGEYGDQLFRWGYTGKVASFEPTSEAWRLLQEQMKRYPGRWTAQNVALGSECGAVQINVSRNSRFSSILGQTAAAKTFDPNMVVTAVETVPLKTLDSLVGEFPAERIYLKIDTQGFEQSILNGGGEFLKKCVGVQLELPVEHLYEGVWSFEGALAYMRERGFVPAQMLPVTVITTDKASVTEFDCVFRRT